MRKSTIVTSFAAASLALSTSAVLVAQPSETPASDNAATPAEPATPATPADPQAGTAATPAMPATPAVPAAKEDPLSPDAAAAVPEAATDSSKDKGAKKKADKKPR